MTLWAFLKTFGMSFDSFYWRWFPFAEFHRGKIIVEIEWTDRKLLKLSSFMRTSFFFYFNGFFSYKIFRWTFDGYRIDKWVRKCYCPFNPRFLPNLTIFTLTSLCTIQFEYNTLNQLRPSFDLPLNFDAAVDSGSAVSDNVNFPQIQNSIHRHHRWINSIYLFDVS